MFDGIVIDVAPPTQWHALVHLLFDFVSTTSWLLHATPNLELPLATEALVRPEHLWIHVVPISVTVLAIVSEETVSDIHRMEVGFFEESCLPNCPFFM